MRYSTRVLLVFAALGLLVVFLTTIRCREPQPRYDYFIIKVDSMNVPDSVSHNDSLSVRLFGTIGGNGAYSLDRIDTTCSGRDLDVTAWGRFDRQAENVVSWFVQLDQSITFAPSAPGPVRIRVHQPDSTILTDSTTVF